jgi:pimeloyl-ACP methyl ester carboxylesterase
VSAASQLQIGAARRVDLAAPGGPIAALQAGSPVDPPVLLVPGYTGSKEDFGPILDALAAAGLFVTAIDLPGQLDSPGPVDAADYAPARLAGSLCALAARLDRPVRLLGHSFGGLVARAAVIAEPARFESLVLLGSGPAAIGGQRKATMDQLDPVLETAGPAAVYAAMQASWRAEPGWVPPSPDLADFLARRFLRSSPAMLRGMADALRSEPDRGAELATTGVPVLVAHGADDDAWPPPVQRAMAEQLAARYAVIPAAAHSPAVENAAATVRTLLDFWG